MLISILFVLYICFIPLPYGWGFLSISRNIFNQNNYKAGFPVLWLSGLALITTLSSFLSLFLSINITVHLLILFGAIVLGCFWYKSNHSIPWRDNLKSIHWLVWVFGAILIISTLEIATRTPSNPDSGLYHAQMIRWIESYPVIPGLGNLHTRFAFNSSWFISNALFSFIFLGGQSFHLLPSALFVVVLITGLQGLQHFLTKGFSYANFFRLLLIPISFYTLASEVSSPGTDLPVTLITWILVSISIEIIESKGNPDPIDGLFFTLISIYTITIKLSAAPLFLFAIWTWVASNSLRSRRTILSYCLVGLVVILPWLIRNVIISGYVIYPFPAIDIFSFDWKIPYENAINDQIGIQNWGRIPGEVTSSVAVMSFSEWATIWFGNLSTFRRLIIEIISISPFVFLALYFIPIQSLSEIRKFLSREFPIIMIVYGGLAFWFFGAPDFRFGYGFLMSALILVMIPFINITFSVLKKWSKGVVFIVALGLVGYQILFLKQSFDATSLESRLIMPADYKSLPTIPCEMNGFSILQPDVNSWSECWYDPFPCTAHCEPNIEMRGESIQDGFRWGED